MCSFHEYECVGVVPLLFPWQDEFRLRRVIFAIVRNFAGETVDTNIRVRDTGHLILNRSS